ncbi:MAG: bifunctional diaminohydroxyphosphoribosylaminopyrimidine deaminase/5-amino-6-(5-phosphoribosylamino)uracil reductase RibD [Ignavibacteria bacterium]|nr:bifunctional diaminohydroxyphosphoribosylaminopyrimidine deaminase/5-amino-6-(5-phosphoribosylamino)uracil reductase RibD [Ignavibacteria bacterium]
MALPKEFISICFNEALKGKGRVSPNPLSGAVIVKNGNIISKGFHKSFGSPHAEISALKKAGSKAKNSTLYLTLEPCTHFGKTPPCADEIIKSGVKKVVVSMLDPNPMFEGKGISKLRNHGIQVETGILKDEAEELNKFAMKYNQSNIPYVTLRIIRSLDDALTCSSKGKNKWICQETKNFIYELRNEYDAVLIGRNLARIENPSLKVKNSKQRQPYRIVLDTNLSLPTNLRLFRDEQRELTIIIAGSHMEGSKKGDSLEKRGTRVIYAKRNPHQSLNLDSVLAELGRINLSSLLVEGGRQIFSSFIRQNLFDELNNILVPKFVGNGFGSAFTLGNFNDTRKNGLKFCKTEKLGDDLLLVFKNENL